VTINILAKILLLILLIACLGDGAVVTVNVDSEQKISEPWRNFEGILTFNRELIVSLERTPATLMKTTPLSLPWDCI